MFRKMRRFKQQLSEETCIKILKEEPRGVLSLIGDDGYPYGFPINFLYDEAEHKLLFHGAKEGHKIDAIKKCSKASFCVYDKGFQKEGEWPLNISSVIVFGKIEFLTDRDVITDRVRKLALKYYPDAESAEEEVRKAADRVNMFALKIEHMTGKLVNES